MNIINTTGSVSVVTIKPGTQQIVNIIGDEPDTIKLEGVNKSKKAKKAKKVKKAKKSTKKRCNLEGCNHKLSIVTWACKCGKKYCSVHKMANSHSCDFDWRGHQIEYLQKNLERGKSVDTKNFEALE